MKRLALMLYFAGIAGAQQGQVVTLSLRRAIELALAPEGNARLELARELATQAEARRRQARAALLPQLESALSYQDVTRNLRAFGFQFPSIPGLPAFSSFVGPFAIVDARASLTQSVFDWSAIRRYQSATALSQAARRDGEQARLQVMDQVARAYLVALHAEARLETAKANVWLAEAHVRLAESQKTAGTGTGVEVTRAQVQLAYERQRALAAENDRTKARLQLLRALDLRLSTEIELTDRLSYHALAPVELEQALAEALRQRPDWKAQQDRERAALTNYNATKLERLPSVAAFADYGPVGPEVGELRPTRSVGLVVRVPVFDGGRRDARRQESASQWRAEQIRSRELREQIELEVRLALDSLRSAELEVSAAEQSLQLAQKELEQAERRYKAGVASGLEVTDAQTRLTRARNDRLAALLHHNVARLELGAATGAIERFLP